MFKSKLQELCHQKLWDLPVYSSTQQGLDHNPRFEATVTVNYVSFRSQNLFKSSKEAQSDAARVALEYFSSPSSPQPLPELAVSSSADSSNESTVHLYEQETYQTTQVNATVSTVDHVHRSRDMQHLYKSQLQCYAQKRNLPLPIYSSEQEGPPHASRFKGKVTVDGQTYESPQFFSTLKEAEHEAAKIAFMSLSAERLHQEDSGVYKNLLQELAQKEGYALPVYNTQRSGESHDPTFVSTVEVEGKVFSGQEAKTKKQAEMSAAKVAYMELQECWSNPSPSLTPAKAQSDYLSSSLQSNVAADQHHHVQTGGRMVFSPSVIPKEQSEKNRELTTVNAEVSSCDLLLQFPQPEIITWRSDSSSSDLSAPLIAENSPSPSSSPSVCSFSSIADCSIGRSVGQDAFTGDIVRVCPHVPNMEFPEGTTVLHEDNNWVAFKLGS